MEEIKEKVKDEVVSVSQKQQETQYKLMGSLKPKKGHTLWKVCRDTLEISKAKFKIREVRYEKALNNDLSKRKEVVIEDGFIYISCLNKSNVVKILRRDYNILVGEA